MTISPKATVSRRTALLGGASAASAAIALAAGARFALAAPTIQSGGGVAGGGTITVDDANNVTANFSLIASRFMIVELAEAIIFGHVSWMDSTGFGFESSAVIAYGMIDGDAITARQIVGTAALMNGAVQPFTIRLDDLGGPGTKKDALKLTIGPADNTIYQVDSHLSTGDLQLIKFDFSPFAGPPAVGSPTAVS